MAPNRTRGHLHHETQHYIKHTELRIRHTRTADEESEGARFVAKAFQSSAGPENFEDVCERAQVNRVAEIDKDI